MPDTTPEQIAARSFRTRMRGYDPDEVNEYLRAVAAGLEELVAERDKLKVHLGDIGRKDLKAEFESIGQEVAAVLEAAREAADSMRNRASADAARWRSESVAEVESERRQAKSDAENLRGDAWAMADDLLKQSQAEALKIAAEAEKEAMRVVGEAELHSHRSTASARREGEEIIRLAKMESERLLLEAQARHDQMIEAAHRQAESAQERARALEARRTELGRELESLRDALSRAELELDERREALNLSPPQVETAPTRPEWEGGETVRVVKPNEASGVAPKSVTRLGSSDSESTTIAPQQQIKLVSAEELKKRAGGSRPVAPASQPEAEPEPEPEYIEPVPKPIKPEPPRASDTPAVEAVADPQLHEEEVVEEETPAQPEKPAVDGDEPAPELEELVTGLFARLRDPGEGESTRPKPEITADRSEAEAAEAAQPKVKRPASVDVAEIRDRRLLPITNRSLRNIKRQLTDEANVVLDQIRASGGEWTASADAIAENIGADLVVLAAESFGAGHAAVEELIGSRVTRPATPKTEPAIAFSKALASALEEAISEAHTSGQGPQQLGSTVSRIFRTWRTDEAERRVRSLALEAYHRGVAATAAIAERPTVLAVAGRGCATCRAAAEESPTPGHLPPFHAGCECSVAVG